MIARGALLLLLMAGAASATRMDPPPQAADSVGMNALDLRLKRLETELRCLVCQNETLADSNADLAADLRREVRTLALAGKSDEDIKTYLVARYGDFVLYDPPVKPITWTLWFGPFALLVVGGVVWWTVLRRHHTPPAGPPGDGGASGESSARALLDANDDSDRSDRGDN